MILEAQFLPGSTFRLSLGSSKVDRGGAGLSAISGCGSPAVDVLIFCTLLLKKSAKSPADSLDDVLWCDTLPEVTWILAGIDSI